MCVYYLHMGEHMGYLVAMETYVALFLSMHFFDQSVEN